MAFENFKLRFFLSVKNHYFYLSKSDLMGLIYLSIQPFAWGERIMKKNFSREEILIWSSILQDVMGTLLF